jgi:hypothetical protein
MQSFARAAGNGRARAGGRTPLAVRMTAIQALLGAEPDERGGMR